MSGFSCLYINVSLEIQPFVYARNYPLSIPDSPVNLFENYLESKGVIAISQQV
jgi:hypothetical protein